MLKTAARFSRRGASARARDYAFAIGASAVAIWLTYVLADLIAPMRLFFLWTAILATAVVGGSGPALLSILLSLCAAVYLLFDPGQLAVGPTNLLRLTLFVTFAYVLSAAVGRRKRAEQSALALSQWLESTLRSISDAVIATGEHGRVLFMNECAEKLTGWTRAEAVDHELANIFSIVGPEGEPLELRLAGETANDDGGPGAPADLRRRDEGIAPVEYTVSTMRDTRGVRVGEVVVFRDITARKALERERDVAEAEVRTSEAKYRTLVEAAPSSQAIWTATGDGSVQWADEWLEITGQTRAEVAEGGGLAPLHPGDVERTVSRWENALATGAKYIDEIRVRVANGRYRWFAIRAVPLRGDGGEIRSWVGIIIDIDDAKRHQSETEFINRATDLLAGSLDYEQTLRTVAKLAVPELGDWCAIDIATDDEQRYRRLTVEHVDPAKARLAFEADAKFRPAESADPIAQVLESQQPYVVERISDESGARVTANEEHLALARSLGLSSWMVVPMIARGRTVGAITIAAAESGRSYAEQDLPLVQELARRAALAIENSRLYADAEAASRAKDEFLATLSHELRTPLTAITGWATMLQLSPLDDETKKLAIDTIAHSARAQGALIEELLELSRVVAGKVDLETTPLDVGDICNQLAVAARPTAEARLIALTFEGGDGPAVVQGDERRLRQIFWNLITNAVKFSDIGGVVTVRVSTAEGSVIVTVSDNGRGIAPEFLPHVWERFRQADTSSTRQYGGLGLGLTVARQFVELHGGTIRAESDGVGCGATFTVSLPLAEAGGTTMAGAIA